MFPLTHILRVHSPSGEVRPSFALEHVVVAEYHPAKAIKEMENTDSPFKTAS